MGGPSDPRFLQLIVKSLSLSILFSFRSQFIYYDRFFCKYTIHEHNEKLPNHFLSFLLKCIYEILKLDFYLFQQVLGHFRQIPFKLSCFVCLRPGPCPFTRPVMYACWTLVREPPRQGQRTALGAGIQESPSSGISCLGSVPAPPLSDS